MSDYVYLSVKLTLEAGQTDDTIQEIVQEMDYSFDHSQIIEHEIIDIMDSHLTSGSEYQYIDLYDMNTFSEDDDGDCDDS